MKNINTSHESPTPRIFGPQIFISHQYLAPHIFGPQIFTSHERPTLYVFESLHYCLTWVTKLLSFMSNLLLMCLGHKITDSYEQPALGPHYLLSYMCDLLPFVWTTKL